MKSTPVPPTEPLGPFPLETNLRKLKPRLAKLGPVVAGLTILLAQEGFWQQLKEWVGTTGGIVAIGLFVSVLLFYLLDLYLKQIWYNERGIGIAKAWGGNRKWYSFEELRDGQFKMRQRTRGPGHRSKQYRPSSRLVLQFHSGSVRIWPNMYDSVGIYELLGILSRRFPDRYAPPVPPPKTDKSKVVQPKPGTPKPGGIGGFLWDKKGLGKTTKPDTATKQN